MSARDVAFQLGWVHDPRGRFPRPDAARVTRALGLRPTGASKRYPAKIQERCTYERAVQLARAIGVDPIDVGL